MVNLHILGDKLLAALLPLGVFCVASCSGSATETDGASGSGGATDGTAGTAGTSAGGAPYLPPGGRDCNTNPIGTCCLYDRCFTPEQFAEFAHVAVQSADASAGACATLTPIAFCTHVVSAVETGDGKCCYVIQEGSCCGRPFVVAGSARTSSLAQRADWGGELRAPLSELTPAEREELTRAWAADALMEHASIASFARFTLELLGLGAPAELVAASQRACLDEVEHARLCFALCSRFGGSTLGPAALDMGGLALSPSLASVAAAVVREGCVGETLATALAQAQLAVAVDPECRRALETIARDEAEHALLAWRFVQWALGSGQPGVLEAVSRAFREARAQEPPASTRPTSPGTWNHFGRLTSEQEQNIVREAWAVVIEPAWAALLESPGADVPRAGIAGLRRSPPAAENAEPAC